MTAWKECSNTRIAPTPSPDPQAVPRVPERVAAVGLNSPKGRVVPRIGLPYITVGREFEMQALLADLGHTAEGRASFRFLVGGYGEDKSFLLLTTRTHALGEGVVVAYVDLSTELRLQGAQGQGHATNRELIRNLGTKTRPEGRARNKTLDGWVANIGAEGDSRGTPLRAQLSARVEMDHGYEFVRVLNAYRTASREGHEVAKSSAVKWLCGEYRTKTDARAELGTTTIITDDTWYDSVMLFARFLTGTGYKGLFVHTDELVNLDQIPNAITRQYNYKPILQRYNDTLQGKAHHRGLTIGRTPTSIEDRRRNVFASDALCSRLPLGRFARGGMRYMLAPTIRLPPRT